jgi:hypothetical protein
MKGSIALCTLSLLACSEAPRMQPLPPEADGPDQAQPAAADLRGVQSPGIDLAPASLAIGGITPAFASSVGRQKVTITGAGFDAHSRVRFGGIEAEVESVTPTQIVAYTPASPGAWGVPVAVTVRRGDGVIATNSNGAGSASAFRYFASSLDFRERDTWSINNGSYTSHRFGLLGDLNNDGRQDLVVTYATANFSTWLNQGAGDMVNFQNTTTAPSNPGTFKAALADLDNDNNLDIAVVDEGSTWIYRLGNGTGSMANRGQQGSTSTGCRGRSLNFGRINNDNFPEMLIACGSNATIGVYNNQFGGNNNVNAIYPTTPSQTLSMPGANVYHALFVDLNKDGKLDVVGLNQNTTGAALSWFMNSNDALPSAASGSVGTNGANQGPQWMACADLSGDGYPDCAVTDLNTHTARVFLNDGAGSLLASNAAIPTGINPRGLLLEDINGDGRPDMIVANSGSHTISVIPGRGDGTFGNLIDGNDRLLAGRVNISLGCRFAWSVRAADLDGDGRKELSASCQNNIADDATRGAVKIFTNISR